MSVRIYTNKFDILYLDIRYGNDERVRSSTKLKNTPDNLKLLKKHIIPNLEVQILNGEFNPKSKQEVVPTTVKDYGYKSLKRHENDRREHINRTYIQHFESKIIPYFGDTLIKNISPIQLLDWQNDLLETKKASSVKKYRTVFNGIFEDARKELINGKKMITENPFRDVRVPKEKEIYMEEEDFDGYLGQINPFSLKEIENIINKTDGYIKNFIGISSRTGMRPGELVALKWSDIDFDNEIIKIRRTRIQGKNGPPKKQASVRNIEMLSGVKEFFESQYNITGCLDGDIFLNSSEKPFYSHDIIAKKFKSLLDSMIKGTYIN